MSPWFNVKAIPWKEEPNPSEVLTYEECGEGEYACVQALYLQFLTDEYIDLKVGEEKCLFRERYFKRESPDRIVSRPEKRGDLHQVYTTAVNACVKAFQGRKITPNQILMEIPGLIKNRQLFGEMMSSPTGKITVKFRDAIGCAYDVCEIYPM